MSNKPQSQTTNDLQFSEAPASWNTRYIDPNGFECQITLRGENGSELLEKAQSAISYLLKNGCQPYSYRGSYTKPKPNSNGKQQTKAEPSGNSDNASWCPLHECEMKRWEKDGRVWYSHKVNGEWCRGK